MRILLVMCLMICPIISNSSELEVMNANRLYSLQSSDNPTDNLFTRAYLAGMIDSNTYNSTVYETPKFECLPEHVSYTQINDIVFKYLKENPQERSKLIMIILKSSIREAFC